MTSTVLDASALLALLRAEPGAERVRAVLADSAMSAANLAEVVSYLARNGADEAGVRQVLVPLPIAWISFDDALAYDAGMLVAATKSAGLSFGDRAYLALARHLHLPAMTADRAWFSITSAVGVTVDLIR